MIKRRKGVTVYGYFFMSTSILAIILLSFLIFTHPDNLAMKAICKVGIIFSIISVVVLYFFLKLRNWARIAQIIFWILAVIIDIFMLSGFLPTHSKNFPIVRILMGIFFLYFLNKASTREQFYS